jgi:predicted AAA+ superfamily ATPase
MKSASREGFKFFTKQSTITDDTVLTAAIADWLLNCDCTSAEKSLRKWADLYPHAGYGSSFKRFVASNEGARLNSTHNGAVMRVSPVGYLATSIEECMELAQESLAGRVAILHMSSLSQHEIYGSGNCVPFTLDLGVLKARENTNAPADIAEIYDRIWKGSMPGLASGKFSDRDVFYSSYLQTYIDRDVKEQVQIADSLLFRDFVRASACRAGQMLNVHDIAQDVGVSDDTAKRWLQVLEKSDVIFFLRPYSNNLLKRTVKTPKMYFFDTGLVAYLTRYSSPEILANGAINGAILENFVVSELLKSYHNNAKECLLWYYRDSNSNEIDMVIESDGMLHPLEIKRSVNPGSELISAFNLLDKASVPRGNGAILCMRPKLSAINSENYIVPIWMI